MLRQEGSITANPLVNIWSRSSEVSYTDATITFLPFLYTDFFKSINKPVNNGIYFIDLLHDGLYNTFDSIDFLPHPYAYLKHFKLSFDAMVYTLSPTIDIEIPIDMLYFDIGSGNIQDNERSGIKLNVLNSKKKAFIHDNSFSPPHLFEFNITKKGITRILMFIKLSKDAKYDCMVINFSEKRTEITSKTTLEEFKLFLQHRYDIVDDCNNACDELHSTYNAGLILKYKKEIRNMFISTAKHNKETGNMKLIKLINNLSEPMNKVDFLSGPDLFLKMKSRKYNKTIYLLGEKTHSNDSYCKSIPTNKTHMRIQDFLLELFNKSHAFIDFYVELGVMSDDLDDIKTNTGQRLYDIFHNVKGYFENKKNNNTRVHGIDARRIISKKYEYPENLGIIASDIRMQHILSTTYKKDWILPNDFKEKHNIAIKLLSKVKTVDDMLKLLIDNINKNKLLDKEFLRSTLDEKRVKYFFINSYLKKLLSTTDICVIGKWFKNFDKELDEYPKGMEKVRYILDVTTAVIMDVYAVCRMFKVFKVKKDEYYPTEASSIIYYSGTGHITPMARFLDMIGFETVEKAESASLSCINLKNIKQPLFL